jgi:phospholipase/carboxylesterase
MEQEDEPTMPCLEIGASREDAGLCVILMHGLGADGHDFEDVAAMLCEAALPKRWRFILPHASSIPVTINMGMRMPAWYDIISLTHPRDVNWDTVAASQKKIEALIAHEPAENLILAGFSQGGAMALHVGLRHQGRIAGVLMMSGYLLEAAGHPVPAAENSMPIRVHHGTVDDVVPLQAAAEAIESLKAAGHAPSFKSHAGLGHSVNNEEIQDIFDWLSGIAP